MSAIDFTQLSTAAQARTALTTLQSRAQEISALRGTIGAARSRLETALKLALSSKTNVEAAASRITDIDYAEEVAQVTRRQILQQTSSAVLAQANQQPRLLLQLLY